MCAHLHDPDSKPFQHSDLTVEIVEQEASGGRGEGFGSIQTVVSGAEVDDRFLENLLDRCRELLGDLAEGAALPEEEDVADLDVPPVEEAEPNPDPEAVDPLLWVLGKTLIEKTEETETLQDDVDNLVEELDEARSRAELLDQQAKILGFLGFMALEEVEKGSPASDGSTPIHTDVRSLIRAWHIAGFYRDDPTERFLVAIFTEARS